jgi:hypothetical protein
MEERRRSRCHGHGRYSVFVPARLAGSAVVGRRIGGNGDVGSRRIAWPPVTLCQFAAVVVLRCL